METDIAIGPSAADIPAPDNPLEYMFHPSSIAVVGASQSPENQGHRYLRSLIDFGFKGHLYPVNPAVDQVLGLRAYPAVPDVPGPVDYVISCVPSSLTLNLVRDCVEKGVKTLHFYTARFGETGLEERASLEKEIVRIGRGGGVRIIGPNCMGIYYPDGGLSFRPDFPKEGGAVGFSSQSGGNTVSLVSRVAGRGVRFSKVVSYGNASDLNEGDFLEYFIQDPETRIIAAYIEGVRDGRRLLKGLRGTEKPVVVLKGGGTAAGRRAVTSHTASLAGTEAIWDAMLRQTGAVGVGSIEEMADVLLAFQYLSPNIGKRVAVLGGGGGESVAAADACERAGLVVPPMPPEIREEMRKRAPDTWSLMGNPLDSSAVGGSENFSSAAGLLASHPAVDIIIGNGTPEWALDAPDRGRFHSGSIGHLIKLGKASGKPFVMVTGSADYQEKWKLEAIWEGQRLCAEAGVPVYPTIGRAAQAVSKVISFYRRRKEVGQDGGDL